ncbi:MAG: hypothetical protein RLZZ238_158 [Planctomycetota bacterium]
MSGCAGRVFADAPPAARPVPQAERSSAAVHAGHDRRMAAHAARNHWFSRVMRALYGLGESHVVRRELCSAAFVGRYTRRMPFAATVRLVFLLCTLALPSAAWADPSGLSKALELAGPNRAEIEKALDAAPRDVRIEMEWLVAHMPEQDLRTLDAAFLTAHVSGALEALRSAPWANAIDREVFRDGILPYASVSETRELWLPALRERCLPMVKDAKTPAEAAVILNQRIFPEFKVKYSTKRRRADQAPSESMESGLASCTGLSILLIDACRSVGVPARFVGVPMWTDGSGNHSWVEVWDGRGWRYTGAAEPAGDRLDEGWFSGRAAGQNREKPEHAIYAVTWRESGVEFPMVFDASRPRARAVDVTDRYTAKPAEVPAGKRLIRVLVRAGADGPRAASEVEVLDASGRVLASGHTKDERFDTNDHLELIVPVGELRFRVEGRDATVLAIANGSKDGEARFTLLAPAQPAASPGAVSGRGASLDLSDDGEIEFFPAELLANRVARVGYDERGPEGELAALPNDADEEDEDGAPTEGASATKAGREALTALRSFLRNGKVADAASQPFAATPLDRKQSTQAAKLLSRAYEMELRDTAKAQFDARVLELDGVKMPFWYTVYGDKPKSGRSLYISMHGGGGAPPQVNDQQWENQKKLYKPEEGVYVAPRAPTDTWNLWHQGHIDPLFQRLIACMIAFEGVDPDRVYLMGYSAGGDGVYQLAPRMADCLAAAAMMAGHPNETKPDGLRNLPFALYMGGKDSAYRRNEIAREWKVKLGELEAAEQAAGYAGGYPHEVTIHEDNGHWMDRKDAVAVPWMARFTRNLHPQRIIWLQDDVTSTRFYWLGNAAPKGGQRVVAVRDGQTIRIEDATGVDALSIWLDDILVDLAKPVRVEANGKVLFEGTAARTIGNLASTLALRGDPKAVFPARIDVSLAPTAAGADSAE